MKKKPYDAIVAVGRFQPFHLGHLSNIRQAAKLTDKIIIIIGSAFQPPTYKNPFDEQQRMSMILAATADVDASIFIEFNFDSMYNDLAWISRIQNIVSFYVNQEDRIGMIGYNKDESSYYLKMFPQWETINAAPSEQLNATDIRALYFKQDCNMAYIKNVVPEPVFDYLEAFRKTQVYQQIIRERLFTEKYKQQFAGLPYPPVFVTSDAVVICQGHVLMIGRKSEPGKGLMALPGGFLNARTDKSVLSCAIRELKEETGIKVPIPVLLGSVKDANVFDAIDRSTRGRTITHAFKIVLADETLPKVKGSDDALWARWIPVGDVNSQDCFDDHYEIIQWAIGG